MAEIAINLVVSTAVNRISKLLIEEYTVLGGAARHAEWIERELRSMQELLEQVEQRTYDEQETELNAWAEKLKKTAGEAEEVIETFVIRSVKSRRRGIAYWNDKRKVGKDLLRIRKEMVEISQEGMNLSTTHLDVSVETPGGEASTTIVAPAMKKLDHILLSKKFATDDEYDEVMELVEGVKDELGYLQNIVSNLNKSTSCERENVWLEEVKDICKHTADVAANFIARKQKRLKMNRLKKVLYLYDGYASARKFKQEMKYIRTQIGDALDRNFTYGVGGKHMGGGGGVGDKQTTLRSKPVSNFPLRRLIILTLAFLISAVVFLFLPFFDNLIGFILFLLINDGIDIAVKTEPKPESIEHKKKKGGKGRAVLRWLRSHLPQALQDLVFTILSLFIPLWLAYGLDFIPILGEGIVWYVKLWMSTDRNLKCAQRNLALMSAFLSDTKSAEGLNERQQVWVRQLRLVAQNVRSLVAASPESSCLSRMKFAKNINSILKEIISISDRKRIYDIADIEGRRELLESSCPSTQGINVEQDRHSSAATSLYRPVTGLKGKVQSIREERELMDALFRDVQDMGEINGRSGIWVKQMEVISHEVESVINDYGTKLEHKPILIHILRYRTQRVISKKIDEIRNKIEDASRRRKITSMDQFRSSATVKILHGRTQPSLVGDESDIIGFDDDAQVLMSQLLSDEKRRCITCIVGIGGTGKTTLAKLIYNHEHVLQHFEHRVWVSATNLNAQQVIDDIANQIMETTQDSHTHHHLLQALAREKYLIVVDGIETCQLYLDALNRAIPDLSTASRVILTTRNYSAAAAQEYSDTTFVHPLQLLDDESSWVLFKRHLNVKDIPPQLIKVGREIVMKCGGLPLAILNISGLLSRNVSHEEWSRVLSQHTEDRQYWLETLHTVNTDIPRYLRSCLFYFELFPAKFEIPVRRLVVLWVAEGLVHGAGEEGMPPERVAERYLTELIYRNIVQTTKRKRNGKVKACRVPGSLRQLWLTKANNESKFLQDRTAKNSIIRRVADHLDQNDIWHDHIHSGTTRRYDSASLKTHYRDVISFLSFDAQEGSKPGQHVGNFLNGCIQSNCFLLLRVLDLERVYKPNLPQNIARLSRLRYLGLRWTYLESLPSSIGSLLKLQTLDLKHTYIHTLPTSIWKMYLRHLFLSETFRTRFPPQEANVNSLSDLQTLCGLFVDEETPLKGGLDTLENITRLELACQSMSSQQVAMKTQLEAIANWIIKLEHLRSLTLKSRDEDGQPWILFLNSFENNINLTDMYLLGNLSSSSVLSQFPPSLVELTLSHSKLEGDPLQILKNFQNLQILSLLAESYTGKVMNCESKSFPQLRVLKLWKLENLEEWKIEKEALPSLRQLEIRSCPRLTMLPNGLQQVGTLLELKLTNMPILVDAYMRGEHKIPPKCKVVTLPSSQ